MLDRDSVVKKLKYLFNVAENDASSDGEISNAMAAAQNLMNKHQIERDDVFEGDDGEVSIDNVTYAKHSRYSRYVSICRWESVLCHFITKFVPGTKWYYESGVVRRNKSGMAMSGDATKITFYGADTDAMFCCEVFDEVCLFVTAAAQLRYGNALARGTAAAYAEGFASGLYTSIRKETKKLQDLSKSDGTSLVVVNRALALKQGAEDWIANDQGVKFTKASGPKSAAGRSRDAYKQGKEDGANYRPGSQKRAGYLT